MALLTQQTSQIETNLTHDFCMRHGKPNDFRLTGRDMRSNLLGRLMKNREKNVALLADTMVMFMQVSVTSEEKNCLRFLQKSDSEDYAKIFGVLWN